MPFVIAATMDARMAELKSQMTLVQASSDTDTGPSAGSRQAHVTTGQLRPGFRQQQRASLQVASGRPDEQAGYLPGSGNIRQDTSSTATNGSLGTSYLHHAHDLEADKGQEGDERINIQADTRALNVEQLIRGTTTDTTRSLHLRFSEEHVQDEHGRPASQQRQDSPNSQQGQTGPGPLRKQPQQSLQQHLRKHETKR